jgi:hypothetical protein
VETLAPSGTSLIHSSREQAVAVTPAGARRGGDVADDPRLAQLLAEQAIRTVMMRYARGIDRCDMELVRGCYWPEATDVHGPFSGTRDEFVAWVEPLLQRHTMTMHHLANVLVEFTGAPDAGHARAETYGVAYHAGEPAGDARWNYAAGFRYVDRVARRAGEWRIADRVTVIEWTTPWDFDRSRTAKFGPRLARRDTADPVYGAGFGPAGEQ